MYPNLDKELKIRGLKKQWLADQIGISKARLSSYVTGKRTMPDHLKIKSAEVLDCTVGYLFFGEGVTKDCDIKAQSGTRG